VDIKELAHRAAMPSRNVRYLIAEGFVDPPDLEHGKANATYGEQHLEQLRLYQTLRDAGLSQRQIRARIEGRAASEILAEVDEVVRQLAPGLEIKMRVSLLPADMNIEEVITRVRGMLEAVMQSRSVRPKKSAKAKGKHNAHVAAEDR